jgi:hypothetical protein
MLQPLERLRAQQQANADEGQRNEGKVDGVDLVLRGNPPGHHRRGVCDHKQADEDGDSHPPPRRRGVFWPSHLFTFFVGHRAGVKPSL